MQAPKQKRAVDIEQLLTWAYRDELPKRRLMLAPGEGATIGYNAGGMDHLLRADNDDRPDPEHTYQRYARVEPVHADAATIESAVSALPNGQVVDWLSFRRHHMIDLIGIAPERDIFVKDIERGAKLVQTTIRSARAVPTIRIRWQVFSPQALVVMHASCGTRPHWDVGTPRPAAVSVGNNRVAVNGSCEGKDRYSRGANCPLDWSGQRIGAPRVEQVAFARLEFVVWHMGLATLADRLRDGLLQEHEPLPPSVPLQPWVTGMLPASRVLKPIAVDAANDDNDPM